MKKLFILDATGLVFRSYHAIRAMSSSQGESTNALFGFIRSINKLLRDYSPTHIAAVFDGPHNERSRKTLYADYKATRGEAPSDIKAQLSWAQEFCQLMGITTLTIEGVEADDTIASIAHFAEPLETEVKIVSTDKDLCQVVTPKIHMLNIYKDNLETGPSQVEEEWGVPPRLICDLFALVGDASDNVPGVAGIGPKGAADLLKEFGSLDGIYKNLDKIKGKKKEMLEKGEKEAFLSRQLVTLSLEIPFTKEASFFEKKEEDKERLIAFYQRFDFHTLLESVGLNKQDHPKTQTHVVETIENLQEVLEKLSSYSEICVDTETTSLDPLEAELVGIGLGVTPEEAWYVPFNGALSKEDLIHHLKPFFNSSVRGFFGHNVKYDLHVLKHAGLPVKKISFDTILASYLLNAHEREHSLDALSLKLFSKQKIPIEALIGKGKKQISMAEVPILRVAEYCCEDVEMTCRLKLLFEKQLEEHNLKTLFETLELPLITLLAKMEERGIFLDKEELHLLSKRLDDEIKKLEESIFNAVGETFNLNSPKQLGQILFEKLGLKPPKKTATGFSTSAEVLESLSLENPVVALILDYRSLEKLRSTYVDALPESINKRTGRIHCTFNQSVTATGRLSCQNPNLQNIPIRTPLGKEIRAAFKPEKSDYSFISGDYSQIELRLMAHLSQDPLLIEAFRKGEDVHRSTAAAIFEIPLKEVTDQMRYQAKAVNFGILYGQQAWGLSQGLGIDPKKAAEFIKVYFTKYKGVYSYLEFVKAEAKKTGVAKTWMGRQRTLPDINSSNPFLRQAAERLAINTPLQGSAADLIKAAMLEIEKRIEEHHYKGKMILQIHDELLFEVPDEEISSFSKLVKETMEGVWTLDVPLIVDIGIGKNWKEC